MAMRMAAGRSARGLAILAAAMSLAGPAGLSAQGLTGTVIGTVRDAQDAVVPGAQVRLDSPAMIGGPAQVLTDRRGQLRFRGLPPGRYSVRVERTGFAPYRADGLALALGANDVPVTVTWRQSGGQPDVVRSYSGFAQVAEEQARSRVYGGIHFQFDSDAGQFIGTRVGDYVFANVMRPLK